MKERDIFEEIVNLGKKGESLHMMKLMKLFHQNIILLKKSRT